MVPVCRDPAQPVTCKPLPVVNDDAGHLLAVPPGGGGAGGEHAYMRMDVGWCVWGPVGEGDGGVCGLTDVATGWHLTQACGHCGHPVHIG